MTLHTTDAQRDEAAAIKLLLVRLDAGQGEDRALGADVVDAVDAPRTIGDPTAQIDASFALARWLDQNPVVITASVLRDKRPQCTDRQLARMLCTTILRVHLANLERAPA